MPGLVVLGLVLVVLGLVVLGVVLLGFVVLGLVVLGPAMPAGFFDSLLPDAATVAWRWGLLYTCMHMHKGVQNKIRMNNHKLPVKSKCCCDQRPPVVVTTGIACMPCPPRSSERR